MISLCLFGPLAVSIDGAAPPAELLWRKNLALLLYLARSPRGRTREHLVGALWPDKDDAKARHSLNEALRVLRRTLGHALNTEGETIRIAAGAVSTDADALDQLDSTTLGLRFLEGFTTPDAPEFDDWITREREMVQAVQLDMLDTRAEHALAQGAGAVTRELALAALRLDSHHEPSARLAMKAAALDGNRAGALETYDRLAGALREIGIEPASETRALKERIGGERAVRALPSPRGGVSAVPRTALVGSARDGLVGILRQWAAVLGRSARTIVLVGDPGTGKTRLISELSARAALDGAVVARGRAVAGESSRETWVALLRGSLEVPELAGAAPSVLATLAQLDPDLAVRFPPARSSAALPLAEGLVGGIRAMAETRPFLLAVDDAQRLGDEVMQTLALIVERTRDLPVMLLLAASAGSSRVDQVAERVGRDLPGEIITLAALNETEAAEMVGTLFPQFSDDQRDRLARRVMGDTAGNPFLAVELARAVADGLKLPAGAGSAWPSARHTLDDTRPGDLPPSVAAALRHRFRQLSERAQRTLAAVAVVGGAASAAALGRAAEVSPAELDVALDELEWTRWLVSDARGYVYATSLAREVVLGDMVTAGQQRRMKERVAGT